MRLTSGQIAATVVAEHVAIHMEDIAADLAPGGWMAAEIMSYKGSADFRIGQCSGSCAAFGEAALIIREHCGQGVNND